jgi:hypothetical protein
MIIFAEVEIVCNKRNATTYLELYQMCAFCSLENWIYFDVSRLCTPVVEVEFVQLTFVFFTGSQTFSFIFPLFSIFNCIQYSGSSWNWTFCISTFRDRRLNSIISAFHDWFRLSRIPPTVMLLRRSLSAQSRSLVVIGCCSAVWHIAVSVV